MPYRLDIPGQVSEFQLRAIEAVAALVPKNGTVVEVGSLFGCTSWAWAKSVDPSVEVVCVDPWRGNKGVEPMELRLGIKYGIEQFLEHVADCPNITPARGYSPRDFKDWDRPIDLYYEDAVHTNPVLSQNLEFWRSHLKPDGIMCGDDYRPRFPDVRHGAEHYAKFMGRELIVVDFFWCLLPETSALSASGAVAEKLRALSQESNSVRERPQLVIARNNTEILQDMTGINIALALENRGLKPVPSNDDSRMFSLRILINGDGQLPFEYREELLGMEALHDIVVPIERTVSFDEPLSGRGSVTLELLLGADIDQRSVFKQELPYDCD